MIVTLQSLKQVNKDLNCIFFLYAKIFFFRQEAAYFPAERMREPDTVKKQTSLSGLNTDEVARANVLSCSCMRVFRKTSLFARAGENVFSEKVLGPIDF